MAETLIITEETRDCATAIENALQTDISGAEAAIGGLVRHLTLRCAQPAVQEKYADYSRSWGTLGPYPLDEGYVYARAFDPLNEEAEMYETWRRFGVVVGRAVAPETVCLNAVQRVKSITKDISAGTCDMDDPQTYGSLPADAAGAPILSRSFFEIYHDDSLAQLRQCVRVYLQHVVLWGRADLWTTFDRYGVKLPGHTESAALPLHVDQNPNRHTGFHTMQGVLALEDCPRERGTLVVVPGSKRYFSDYATMARNDGDYVELDPDEPIAGLLASRAQAIPLRQGDLASWDSRTTHANTANISKTARFVALIAAGLAREDDPAAHAARAEAFRTGLGSNVRDALMHASMRPRYTDEAAARLARQPEQLHLLGRLLYGQESYANL